ncbi:signal peptidase II [Dermacoccus profundi]|uniref:Lipoprotein signal peptidase n=3 Tax=Dermacoccaceae TaxID=145357 RepID=A0A417Z771_9MICO|nr:signal peptidase II [Dermacoccus abyssi]
MPVMQAEAGASLSSATTPDHPRTPRGASTRHLAVLGLAAATAYGIDQATKAWALDALADGHPREVIGSFLRFQLTHNPGAAFSLGTNSTIFITAIAVAVVIAVLVTARKLRSTGWALAFGLIVGGAVGNLTDRFFRPPGGGKGYVVDFLQLPNWPIFNVADIAICTAAALVVVLTFRGVGLDGIRDRDRERETENDGNEDAA